MVTLLTRQYFRFIAAFRKLDKLRHAVIVRVVFRLVVCIYFLSVFVKDLHPQAVFVQAFHTNLLHADTSVFSSIQVELSVNVCGHDARLNPSGSGIEKHSKHTDCGNNQNDKKDC